MYGLKSHFNTLQLPQSPSSPNSNINKGVTMFPWRNGPGYVLPLQPPARQMPATSSAFSASANPDEDWTQISDLAERRRIQNRIAQRNYRKKLKRRLEDLERRAGSPDEAGESDKSSPRPMSNTNTNTNAPKRASPSKASAKSRPPAAPPVSTPAAKAVSPMQFSTPFEHHDDVGFQIHDRLPSSTPPAMNYSAPYPPPEECMLAPYASAQPYHQPIHTMDSYSAYTTTAGMAPTVPSMTHFNDAFKRDSYSSDAGFNSYSPFNYYPSPGDMHSAPPGQYDPSNAQTPPPLSYTFDNSEPGSDAGYDLDPTTPPFSESDHQTHPLF